MYSTLSNMQYILMYDDGFSKKNLSNSKLAKLKNQLTQYSKALAVLQIAYPHNVNICRFDFPFIKNSFVTDLSAEEI